MQITNYTELKSAVADWLNRADLEQRIPEFVQLAEATLNKVVRTGHMVTKADIPLTNGTRIYDVPADMIEPVFMVHDGGADDGETLEQVSVQQLNWLRKRMRDKGTPRFYAIIGRKIHFAPIADGAINLDLHYYQRLPALQSNATNLVLTNEPDLYLYTALLHAAPFLKDDAKTQLFGNLVAQQVASAVQQQKVIQFDSKMPGATLNAPSDVR